MHRRTFFASLSLPAFWVLTGTDVHTVKIRCTSWFDAPFVRDELRPGLCVGIQSHPRGTAVYLGTSLLGFVPREYASAAAAEIARVGSDEDERLQLWVRIAAGPARST